MGKVSKLFNVEEKKKNHVCEEDVTYKKCHVGHAKLVLLKLSKTILIGRSNYVDL